MWQNLLLLFVFIRVGDAYNLAVVGSGAAGSSLCYFLNQLALSDPSLNLTITLYEKEAEVGGRVKSVPVMDGMVDLGASIFITENEYMYNFTRDLGVGLDSKPQTLDRITEAGETMALWDGSEVLWSLNMGYGKWDPKFWWQLLQLGWRFGFDTPFKVSGIVKDFVQKFSRIYTLEVDGWSSTQEVLELLGFGPELVNQSAHAWFIEQGVNVCFIEEFINGLTRVNYGTNVQQIHALAGLVSLAPLFSSVWAVQGGNQRLIKKLLDLAMEDGTLGQVKLSNPVTLIQQSQPLVSNNDLTMQQAATETLLWSNPSPTFQVQSLLEETREYDGVVLAVPLDVAEGLELRDNLGELIKTPRVTYQKLFVTVIEGALNASYFGLDDVVPSALLTHPAKNPIFVSLSKLKSLPELNGGVFKFFSYKRLEDEDFSKLFKSWNPETLIRQEWWAYPQMTPDNMEQGERVVELKQGLWYVNAFEPAISTMETEIIAAKNVVNLITKRLK